mgnify:CR=1 FL=1
MEIKLDITVPTILLIIFITLKLTRIITWSWFWVLSPIWIYGILILILFAIILVAHCNIRKRW